MATKSSDGKSGPTDPFDVDALRATPLDGAVVESSLLTIAVRRPKRTEFIRVNPEPEYAIDNWALHFDGGTNHDDIYWIAPAMHGLVEDARATRFVLVMTRVGVLLLWPLKLPTGESSGRRWNETGLIAADMAKERWVKVTGNREAGAYEAVRAVADFGDPRWPDLTMREILGIAFPPAMTIATPDHPALRLLRGEI